MTHHTLSFTLTDQPGALERLLRVVRVRGFTPETVRFALMDGGWRGVMSVTGERSIENLQAQLAKLEDVVQIDRLHAPKAATVVQVA